MEEETSQALHELHAHFSTSFDRLVHGLTNEKNLAEEGAHDDHAGDDNHSGEHDCDRTWVKEYFTPPLGVVASKRWQHVVQLGNRLPKATHLAPGPFETDQTEQCIGHDQDHLPAGPAPGRVYSR